MNPAPKGASAPGKLMVAGEYAVLEGAPALVAAVSARAKAYWSPRLRGRSLGEGSRSPRNPSLPPEALIARTLAEELRAEVPHLLNLDVDDLRRSDRKLGLGSSAAGAAASAGAVFAFHGEEIESEGARRQLLDLAMRAHREVAPQGSGADVAAAVLGGVVQFQREGEAYQALSLPWPQGLVARLVWTGREARTSDFLAQIHRRRARDGAGYRRVMDALGQESEAFVHAFREGSGQAVVESAARYGAGMDALGQWAELPVLESTLRLIAELAGDAGGAAKPSGAGGGDVAIAFFTSEGAARDFENACERRASRSARAGQDRPQGALEVLSLRLGEAGVRSEYA